MNQIIPSLTLMTGQTVSGRRWKVSGRWNDMRIRFPYKQGRGEGRSCVDFIKGGLDSHNGRCERGHRVAIRAQALDIAFFRTNDQKEQSSREMIIKREGKILFFESRSRS